MALKKETIEKIAALTKVPVADLEAAIKAEQEVDVTIPEGLSVFTTEEITTRDNNKRNEGISTGKELGIKEVRTAAGIEEGIGKDPVKVAAAIVDKAVKDAKIQPDARVTQLNEQVTLLQTKNSEMEKTVAAAQTVASQATLDAKLISLFPKNRAGSLTDGEYLTLIKSRVSFEEVDGKTQVKKDGQVMRKINTQDPLTLEEAIPSIFDERKWVEVTPVGGGGRGGKDVPPGAAITSLKGLREKYTAEGKSIQGQEFAAELQQLVKENKDFDMKE